MGNSSSRNQRYKRKDRIIVREKGTNVRHEGRISDLGSKGVYVDFGDGVAKPCFYFWADVVGLATTAENFLRARSGLATLGEVVDLSKHMPSKPLSTPPASGKAVVKAAPKIEANVVERPHDRGGRRIDLGFVDDPIREPPKIVVETLSEARALTRLLEQKMKQRNPKKMQHHEMTPIAARVRAERLKRRNTQEQFAKFLGAVTRTLSRIELGDTAPDDVFLLNLAEKCNIDLEELETLRNRTSFYEREEADIMDAELGSVASSIPTVERVSEPTIPIALGSLAMTATIPMMPAHVDPPSTETMFQLYIESTNANLLLQLMCSAQELGLAPKLEKK
jgi:transcriptional regulator with XRE-family HTH domain